jgi:hypothetical protein
MKKFSIAGLLSLVLLILSIGVAGAQTTTTGDLAGQVTDPGGAAVAGATVTLKSLDYGTTQIATTNSSGNYRFSLLKPGRYTLTEEGGGMSASVPTIEISVGKVTPLDIVAKPVGGAAVVEVTTGGALLQTEDANLTTNFSAAQLDAMPLPGGDLANVPFTAPGINLSTGAGYGSFTAFGLPATSNLFTTNGNDTMDPYNNLNNSGASNLTLGANEVQDVAVINNAYTGQYGRMAGAQVNFTTKSGSNRFHGNAIYYFNGDFMNSNDWFNKHDPDPANWTPRPHAISNQWVGSIGGPIIKDKLFFFFDDEGLRYVLPGGGPAYIPSPQFQTAVTNNIAKTIPGESAYYKSIFGIYNGASQASRATAVTAALDPALGCGDFDGTTTGGVTFGTGATPCAYVFQNTAGSLNTEQLYSIRVDQNWGAKDKLSYRYKHDWGVQATGTDALNPAFNANSVQPEWDGQFNETHIFSPNLVNNLILSGLYYSAIFGPPNIKSSLAVFPTTILYLDGLGFANVGGTNYNYPQGRNVSQYMIVDDVSYTHGRNTYKFGVNFRRNNITDFRAGVLTSGRTEFFSNTDFYSGVLGYNTGSFVQQRFAANPSAPIATYTLGFYFQDQVALTEKLKVTASLRFDRNANPVCRTNCFARMNGPFTSITHDQTGTTVPYNQSISTGLSNAYPSTNSILFQPRAGFAYSVTPKTVIRGGAGYFSDLIPAQLVDNFILNTPNVNSFTVRNNGAASTLVTVVPGSSDPTSGYNVAAASNKALNSGFASGATYAQLRTATNGFFSAPTYSAIVNKLHNPMYVEWNLELQQALSKNDVLEINYVGNYGYNLLQNNALVNAHASGGLASFGGVSSAIVDQRFATVTQLTNFGHSNYNGITTAVRHDMRYGVTAQFNYTYSHDLDTVSNGGLNGFDLTGDTVPLGQINPFSNNLNYGNADYDIKHSFSMNYLWRIPGASQNAILKTLTNGWTMSGTMYWRGGYPFSVVNTKTPGTYLAGQSGGIILAGYKGGGMAQCQNGNSTCLTTAQFATSAQQPNYGFGNISRNSQFRAPHYYDTDMSLIKTTKVAEKVDFRIGASFFNILNHANFYKPQNDVTNGSFGHITTTVTPPSSIYGSFTGSAVSGRIIQLQGGISF